MNAKMNELQDVDIVPIVIDSKKRHWLFWRKLVTIGDRV